MELQQTTERILGAAIAVHRTLGPGLLESVYARCLAIELRAIGMRYRREAVLDVIYRSRRVAAAYRIDLLVEEAVVVEVKAVAHLDPIHKAQLLTYLRLAGCRVGLILNFNTAVLRDGIVRMIR